MDTFIYILNIVETFAVVFGAGFAIFQYCKSKKKEKIAKAVELAGVFKKEIIIKISFLLQYAQNDKEFYDYIQKNKKRIYEAEDFNVEELNLITKNDPTQYENFYISTFKKVPKVTIGKNRTVRGILTIGDYMMDVLNDIEHWSIYFNSKIADDNVVYQSLHQILIDFLPIAYYGICKKNDNQYDKLYTNTIDLYKRWIIILNKSMHKESKLKKNTNNEIAVTKTPRA